MGLILSSERTIAEIRAEIKKRRRIFRKMLVSGSCMTGHEVAYLSGAQEAMIGLLNFIDRKEKK